LDVIFNLRLAACNLQLVNGAHAFAPRLEGQLAQTWGAFGLSLQVILPECSHAKLLVGSPTFQRFELRSAAAPGCCTT
jgi:hypothetical protein